MLRPKEPALSAISSTVISPEEIDVPSGRDEAKIQISWVGRSTTLLEGFLSVCPMWPVWLCILWSKQFEETFENTQRGKVKQMQIVQLCILACRQPEDSFVNALWGKAKQIQNDDDKIHPTPSPISLNLIKRSSNTDKIYRLITDSPLYVAKTHWGRILPTDKMFSKSDNCIKCQFSVLLWPVRKQTNLVE